RTVIGGRKEPLRPPGGQMQSKRCRKAVETTPQTGRDRVSRPCHNLGLVALGNVHVFLGFVVCDGPTPYQLCLGCRYGPAARRRAGGGRRNPSAGGRRRRRR